MTRPLTIALSLTRMALALVEAAEPLDEGVAELRLKAAIAALDELVAETREAYPGEEV